MFLKSKNTVQPTVVVVVVGEPEEVHVHGWDLIEKLVKAKLAQINLNK
jgi:hypothetical protein